MLSRQSPPQDDSENQQRTRNAEREPGIEQRPAFVAENLVAAGAHSTIR